MINEIHFIYIASCYHLLYALWFHDEISRDELKSTQF